jgi:hypothetical protein
MLLPCRWCSEVLEWGCDDVSGGDARGGDGSFCGRN